MSRDCMSSKSAKRLSIGLMQVRILKPPKIINWANGSYSIYIKVSTKTLVSICCVLINRTKTEALIIPKKKELIGCDSQTLRFSHGSREFESHQLLKIYVLYEFLQENFDSGRNLVVKFQPERNITLTNNLNPKSFKFSQEHFFNQIVENNVPRLKQSFKLPRILNIHLFYVPQSYALNGVLVVSTIKSWLWGPEFNSYCHWFFGHQNLYSK